MNTRPSNRGAKGLTLVEALVVVAVLAMLGCLLLPALAHPHQLSTRISCVNNLKQIGTAFRIWAEDNANAYPWETSTINGGSREYAHGPEIFRHFQAMQNEMGQSPKIVVCPSDRERFVATNFLKFNNSNVSYFVGVTVSGKNENPNLLLGGDRNLANGTGASRGLMKLTTNDLAGWTIGIHGDTRYPAGNTLFSDGSVQMMGTPGLRQALKIPGVAPALVAVP